MPAKCLPRPCPSCPWVRANKASDIPNFAIDMAEGLASTSPDRRGVGPDWNAPQFACHQSKPGEEFPCAGWLAVHGRAHPGVRWNLIQGHYEPSVLDRGADWPELHASYQEMMDKLRTT